MSAKGRERGPMLGLMEEADNESNGCLQPPTEEEVVEAGKDEGGARWCGGGGAVIRAVSVQEED